MQNCHPVEYQTHDPFFMRTSLMHDPHYSAYVFNVSDHIIEYCDPTFNLNVRSVHVGCFLVCDNPDEVCSHAHSS